MAANSAIEWTDTTWNPVVGCSKVSPGCAHCYAETMAKRIKGMALADIAAGKDPGKKRHYIDAIDDKGRWSGKMIPVPESLFDPLGWRKPRHVFVNSMSDLFHEDVPDKFIFDVLDVCHQASIQLGHVFQILTKRARRMHSIVCRWIDDGHLCGAGGFHADVHNGVRHPMPPGIWLGISAEDQPRADERLPWLLKTPAAVRFVSAEPLLGPINFRDVECWWTEETGALPPGSKPECDLDWVIVGGESGGGSRRCNIQWIRKIVADCNYGNVPCFVKQLGSKPYVPASDSEPEDYPSLENKKGGDPAEWPADLRVRQFPREVARA